MNLKSRKVSGAGLLRIGLHLSFLWRVYCRVKAYLRDRNMTTGGGRHSFRFRFMVWVNIACQLLLPLGLSFTPLVTEAQAENRVPPESGRPRMDGDSASPAVPGAGASVKSGSSDSPDSLPVLGGADGGDGELRVAEAAAEQQNLDRSLSAARRLWGVLGSSSPGKQGVDMAAGVAGGMANQAVQDWLNQYGSARFSFSTQGTGSADLLFPLLDRPDYLFYAQGGVRRGNDRTTGNFGLGGRFFTPDWMFGVNTFYDNDFTGSNRRLGLGVEAWRDYLKLSANGYMRLSGWHRSPLHESRDYDERPANGFDVRAEGWLPAWPQLGGKLMYERYQGKDVALSGDFNSRRNNPSAVTAGLSYTPFPLLKVGVEHRAGSGTGDTSLNLDFSYRFGVLWSEQINPQMVGPERALVGTRYDLVDRNYDIVLQYRKQELISLSLSVDRNPGFAGEDVTVTVTAGSKYRLAGIEWSAPELLAAGGSLTPVGKADSGVVRVELPSMVPQVPLRARSVSPGGRFVIEAIARDEGGNEARGSLELIVVRSPRDVSVRVAGDGAVADGVAVNRVEVLAQDADSNQPLVGEEVELVFTYANGPQKGTVLDTQVVKTDESGRAVGATASRIAADVNVSARLKSNGNTANAVMSFVADAADVMPGEPVVSGADGDVVADGVSGVTLLFPVVDAGGQPLAGREVVITTTNGAKPERVTVTTDEQGNAGVTVTSTVAGVATVMAETAGGKTQSKDIVFVPGAPDVSQSEFAVSPAVLVADGVQGAEARLVLKDRSGNRIVLVGGDVSFDVAGPDGATLSAVSCGGDGCTAMLRGTLAGDVTLVPVVRGSRLDGLAAKATLKAAGDVTYAGALEVVNATVPADDKTPGVVRMVVTDAAGNPVEGVRVEFHADVPAHFLSTDYATDSRGIASASLVSSSALEARVTATVNGSSVSSEIIRFVENVSSAVFDGAEESVLPAPVVAGQTTPVVFTVKDAAGTPVSGQPVRVRYPVPGVAGADVADATLLSDENGRVSVDAGSNKAGRADVVAEVNGHRQTVRMMVEADAENPAKAGDAGGTTLKADPSTLQVGEVTTVTLELKDRYGNAIAGRSDVELSDGSRLTETAPGVYTAPLSVNPGTAPGIQQFSVRAGAVHLGEFSLTVADSALPDDADADLVIKENDRVADGTAKDVLALTLADVKKGDVAVRFSVAPASGTVIGAGGGAVITPTGGNTEGGSLEATVTSKTAGDFIVTAELAGGKTISKAVTFVADARTAMFGNNPHLTDITATAGSPAAVSFVVQDVNGNLVKNQPVTITADNGATPSSVTVVTGADGVASVQVSNDRAGETTVTAGVGGKKQSVKVTFEADGEHPAGVGGAGGSVLTVPDELVAGVPATVSLELKDDKGNAMTGRTDITLSDGTRFTETAPGKYEAPLQEDLTGTGNKDVSVLVGGETLQGSEKSIPVKAGVPDAGASLLDIQPDTILADGKTTSTVSLTLKDGKGNPVTGRTADVTLIKPGTTVGNAVTLSGVTEASPGVYTATLSGTVSGVAEVTASVDGQSYSKAVTLTPDESTASVNGLTVKETSVPADGMTANTLTATVVDAGGNPVQGVTVDWSKSSGVNASLAGNTSMTNERGEATMEVTGTAAETAGIQAKVGANAGDAGQSADAVFTLYPVVGVTVTKDNVSADGTTAGTVEVTVKDLAGAPVAGQAVTLTTASGVTASSTGVTDADGKLSVDVTSTVSGVTDVAASVGAGDRQEATAQLNFGRYVRFDGLTLTHTPPTTDATNAGKMCQADCEITLSAMVTDAGGNPVPGVDVHFQGSVTGDDALVVASGTDGMVSVTRKYDKGGVEDVSLVAASQGVTIGTSAAKSIDILPVMESKMLTPLNKSAVKTVITRLNTNTMPKVDAQSFDVNELPLEDVNCEEEVVINIRLGCELASSPSIIRDGSCDLASEIAWEKKQPSSVSVLLSGVVRGGTKACVISQSSMGQLQGVIDAAIVQKEPATSKVRTTEYLLEAKSSSGVPMGVNQRWGSLNACQLAQTSVATYCSLSDPARQRTVLVETNLGNTMAREFEVEATARSTGFVSVITDKSLKFN